MPVTHRRPSRAFDAVSKAREVSVDSQPGGTQPRDRQSPVRPNNKRGDERRDLESFKPYFRREGRKFKRRIFRFVF